MSPPVVAFGTGGSGTRALARVLAEGGVYVGPKLNRAGDALCLKPFLRAWPEAYLERTGWVDAMWRYPGGPKPPAAPAEIVAGLREAVACQRRGIPEPGGRWGWKAPRTILVLPLVDELFEGARTIQLVRDGRDMAYSRNRQQVDEYGPIVLADLDGALTPPEWAIAMWSRVNVAAASYGRAHMDGRHLVVRYEDLGTDPAGEVARILAHAGLDDSPEAVERAAAHVSVSGAVGRWREAPASEAERVAAAGAEGLRTFGYA